MTGGLLHYVDPVTGEWVLTEPAPHEHADAMEFFWKYDSSSTMADPGNGFLRSNTAAGTPATALAISNTTAGDTDVTHVLRSLTTGDMVFAQKQSQSDAWVRYRISGVPTFNATWVQIPVTQMEASGVTITKNDTLLVRFTMGGGGGATMDARYLRRDGGNTMSGSLGMGNNVIYNVANPTADDHALNRGSGVQKSGDQMTGPLRISQASIVTTQRLGSWQPIVSSTVGYLVITLPGPSTGSNNAMVNYRIRGYCLDTGWWEVRVGGYHYASIATPQWYAPNADFFGRAQNTETVMYVQLLSKGAQGSATYAIALGGSTTNWQYPVVYVEADYGYQGGALASGVCTFAVTTDLSSWRVDYNPIAGMPDIAKLTYPEIKMRKVDGAANTRQWKQYISGTAGESGVDAASLSFVAENDDDTDQGVVRFYRDGRIQSVRPYSGFVRNTDTTLTADVEYKVVWETEYGQPASTQAAMTMAGSNQFTMKYTGTYFMEIDFSMVNTAVKVAPIDFGIRDTGGGASTVTMTANNTIANSWSDRLTWSTILACNAGYSFYVYVRPVGAAQTGWKFSYARILVHRLS